MLLEKLADRLEQDRFDLAALQTLEVSKPWREADADVAEAIDFCRYYARQSLIELAEREQGSMAGEKNLLTYEGRGVAVVIAPWNFPLAILCGMTTAALVAGNTVIMKPAEQSSAIAFSLFTRMIEVGFPQDVVHFLPGDGAEVGAHLVAHKDIAQIAFTGSKAVGLRIIEKAAHTQPGQEQVKRVVCEMGGKNAIIVDEDADLDEAVAGVIKSAFGFAGQKCSAALRAVIVGSAYEPFVKRLVEACGSLQLAPGDDPACVVNPVVDRDAFERLKNAIANPGEGAQRIYSGEAASAGQGYFIAPAVFEVQNSQHRLMQEEFFGPVLAVSRAESFEQALRDCERRRVQTDRRRVLPPAVEPRAARRKFRVGNLYLNRGCNRRAVHRQPFGGFGMSGLRHESRRAGILAEFRRPPRHYRKHNAPRRDA